MRRRIARFTSGHLLRREQKGLASRQVIPPARAYWAGTSAVEATGELPRASSSVRLIGAMTLGSASLVTSAAAGVAVGAELAAGAGLGACARLGAGSAGECREPVMP